MMLFKIFEMQFDQLDQMRKRKSEILICEKPLLNLKYKYVENSEKGEGISGYEEQSYHSMLLNR